MPLPASSCRAGSSASVTSVCCPAPEFPIHECAELNLAATLDGSDATLLVANRLLPGELEVAVDGASRIGESARAW
jgi:hypothetical protein